MMAPGISMARTGAKSLLLYLSKISMDRYSRDRPQPRPSVGCLVAAPGAIEQKPVLRVTRRDNGFDVAADVEVADDLHVAGSEQADEVIEDPVDGGLVKHLLVPELVDVEL